MTFTGQGTIDIRGILLRCQITYDTTGTRTSCPAAAAAAAVRPAAGGAWAHIVALR